MTLSTGNATAGVPAPHDGAEERTRTISGPPARSALLERFSLRLEKLGVVTVYVVGDASIVAATVAEALRKAEVKTAMIADDLGVLREPIRRACNEAAIAVVEGDTPAMFEPVEAGISLASFGVAETGSIGVVGNPLQPRVATLLPPVHMAVVDAATIVASLDEAGDQLEKLMRPGVKGGLRYASLVTGPSRTADVEKTLAVGVHGPRSLHVIIFEINS